MSNSMFLNYDNGENRRTDPNRSTVVANEDGRIILNLADRAKTIIVDSDTKYIEIRNGLVGLGKPKFKNATEEEQIEAGYGIHTAASLGDQKRKQKKQLDVQNEDGTLSDEMLKLIEIAATGANIGEDGDNGLRIVEHQADGENSFLSIAVDGHRSTDVIRIEGTLALQAIAYAGLCETNFEGSESDDWFNGLPGDTCIDGNDGSDSLVGDAFYANNDGGQYFERRAVDETGGSQDIYNQPSDFGDDTIFGRAGSDTVYGDVYTAYNHDQNKPATLSLTFGNDFIAGGGDNDTLYGDALQMINYAHNAQLDGASFLSITAGDDILIAGTGGGVMYGDSYTAINSSDHYSGDHGATNIKEIFGGDDNLTGGVDADDIYGDFYEIRHERVSIDETSLVAGGDDTAKGEEGRDLLIGDAFRVRSYDYSYDGSARTGGSKTTGGDDDLDGGADNDIIVGDFWQVGANGTFDRLDAGDLVTGGNDVITGGTGNDELWGDFQTVLNADGATISGGADIFVFGANSGIDDIHDFEDPGAGLFKDRIDVSALGFTSLMDFTLVESFGNTVIDLDGTVAVIDQVAVRNVIGLGEEDFIFA